MTVHNDFMARPRTQSDADIFAHLIVALCEGGEKALSFGSMSQRCGLAPATLAQRFGSVEAMVRAALLAEWARLSRDFADAEAEALASSKGAQALLKRLPVPSPQLLALSLRDESLRKAAEIWREEVVTAIAARRGGGTKGREAAALIFAAWQGRSLWENAGGKGFRLAEMLKALP